MNKSENFLHPGIRIKNEVIPKGMTVTKAAELMGIGRPALSNLLNGKASLSAEMATRLEKTFNYPRKDLLDMQAKYDEAKSDRTPPPDDIKSYVPPFLRIKANQIEQWVTGNISARTRLSVFLRTLVHSTGRELKKVDFPGNNDAERPGWDGFVEAGEGAPWIPAGFSGWEFGTNVDIKTKADKDFNKSVEAISQKDREETTFVFVTPREWRKKAEWVEMAKSKELWKDVRAYDASDLEQWIEQSLPGQAWFANETQIPAHDVRSLDKCWSDWANISTPPLTGTLFNTAIEAFRKKMISRLAKPPEGPTVIAADSIEEALAFLAQILGEAGGNELSVYRDRVLVFDKPGVFPRLAIGAQSFIPVAFTREVERELGTYVGSMHSIIVYPRGVSNIEPHIVLEPANYETFKKALEKMGKNRDEINRLDHESGRSLTVLRRRLSSAPAIRTPEWASDHETAASLIPFFFVGTWNSGNETDKLGLSLLSGDRPYIDLEKECQRLTQLNDSPVWSIGTYRGVISKIDLLYAIAGNITLEDLTRYFSMARLVLGEDDPALDLEEKQRWLASLYGKTREFSSAFRKGISETLVLLSVHGNQIFKNRLAIDTEVEARRVVQDLLPTPLNTRKLEGNDHDLPTYAEAAPDEFLSILERDLRTDSPAVLGLLHPADADVFGRGPSRTGLLWALEGLSWNPETLPRAVLILAKLAQVEINDNWVNKPMHSLESIFRSWMPQTAANYEMRVALMKKLAERFPDIAWKICMTQIGNHHGVGNYSHKPRWRPDGYGFGEPLPTWGPVLSFRHEMVEMALGWKEHSLVTFSDILERLPSLDDSQQARVWTLVEEWSKNKASDDDKAAIRQKIRTSILSRYAVILQDKNARTLEMIAKAKIVYAALEPSDLLNKHAWLFEENWISDFGDEEKDFNDFDFKKHEERLRKKRVAAMREVFDQLGFKGLLDLAVRGNASLQIGVLASRDLFSEKDLQEFLRLAVQPILSEEKGVYPLKNLIVGALHGIDDDNERETIIKAIATGLSEENLARILVFAPFSKRTWKMVDTLAEPAQAKFWTEVVPEWIHHSDEENNEGVKRLLKAERPRAAFYCVRFHLEKIDAQVLFNLLSDIAKGGHDQPGEYLLNSYNLLEAFKYLNKSLALTIEQKAGLEFAFIDILSQPRTIGSNVYGIPNLERYIEAHPEFFVQILTWVFNRKDDSPDPEEFQIPSDRRKDYAERGYKLLGAFSHIPGHDDLGELKADLLSKWITVVRRSSAELNRLDIADDYIGKLLAHAPVGNDGNWPCEPVRQVMEDIQSETMMRGACIGVYNLRGVHFRGEGGDQERELAEKYRNWGKALQFSYPYVSSKLLMEIVKTYEREVDREDTEAAIRRRFH